MSPIVASGRRRGLAAALLLLGLALLPACSGRTETGPGKVRWDAVTCERCRMAVSDRRYAAQVRGAEAARRTRLYFFDDIGCAVLWLQEQAWRADPRTEIWVTAAADGTWLEARGARYAPGHVTPMDFGLGAATDATDATIDYEQAVLEIRRREHRPQPDAGR